MYQVGFLGWLLKNCASSFLQQYAAYSQQVVLECIASVHRLIEQCEQGRDKLTLVQPLLQAWSKIISPVLDESHKYPATSKNTSPVCNPLKAPLQCRYQLFKMGMRDTYQQMYAGIGSTHCHAPLKENCTKNQDWVNPQVLF